MKGRLTSRPGGPRPRRRPLVLAAAAVGLAGVSLSACGGSGGNAITLYNGQHVQTTDALVTAFEQQTGITVNVRSNDENTLANQIATEGSSSPADVFYGENSPSAEYLQQKGLLAKVDASTLAEVPSRFNSAEGKWVGVSARVSVVVYNPSLISPRDLPTSVLQLADRRYQGKVALAPGETDFQPVVTSVLHSEGRAATLRWLEGLKSNAGGHIYSDNETVTNEVNRGVVALGLIDQYYWYRLRAQIGTPATHSRIAYFAPHDPGYVIDVSPAAVVKSSSHQALAQRFVAFLVSERGQAIIAHSQSYEYPLAARAGTARGETPLDRLQPSSITISQLGDGSQASSLLKQVGLL